MTIGLVGWGLETQSVYRYLGGHNDYVIYSEEPRDDFPKGSNITVKTLTKQRQPGVTSNVDDLSYLEGIEVCDKIVLTPTAKKSFEKLHPKDTEIWEKTTTNLQIFFEDCPTKNIIGVTGTKGKGTTSSLVTQLLKDGGKKVHLGGNIGIPALDLIAKIDESDWVVLELSSFQLHNFPYSPHIAVHLMMIPEHIDEWHLTLEDYIDAKANIFRHQKAEDIAVYLPTSEFSAHNVELSVGKRIPYMQKPGALVEDDSVVIDSTEIIKVKDVGLTGEHNLENICAAVTTVWNIHQDVAAMRKTIKNFHGLEHRLQFVRKLKDITYIDDSFGTTPDTAVVAMNSFEQPKVMIIGGHDKGNDNSTLIDRLQENDIRSIIGIGKVGNDIVHALQDRKFKIPLHTKSDYDNWSMKEIVELAQNDAKSGDIVLLSTGTSSFGIFKDYKERGRQFIETVKKLK